MANSFGTIFRVTTWGESHGPALGAVIDGCPANLPLTREDIQRQLQRDVPDKELGTTRVEKNRFEILSGVFEGKTLGTPISIVIWNNDPIPLSYEASRNTLRPGHADLTYFSRYKHTDWRGGSRASGRECVARLAAGAVARKLAETVGIDFRGKIVALAGIAVQTQKDLERARQRAIEIGKSGDSTGGIVEIRISGVPAGIGSPVFGKLQADLGHAFLTIGGVKGIESGSGFAAADSTGSQNNDPIGYNKKKEVVLVSNNCGGVLGGISTGGDLVFRLGVKPTPTIAVSQKTVNIASRKSVDMKYHGRFDVNFTPRVIPIAEAMAACVIVDHLLMSGKIPPSHL